MPRVKAKNYDEKRDFILNKAAHLFADSGYPSARMIDIANACDASKSMLYHYFSKKEDILFAILTEHLKDLVSSIEKLTAIKELSPRERVFSFVDLFVSKSSHARTRHLVAVLDVKYLPKSQQTIVKNQERQIVLLAGEILQLAQPKLPENDYKLYALLLIGTINSMDSWSQPSGHYTPQEMANKVSNLFLDGFLSAYETEVRTRVSC